MSLKTNVQYDEENPFREGDLFKRDILWKFMNNEKNPDKIQEDGNLYRAFEKFSWFSYNQQELFYSGLNTKLLRLFTKYLKEQGDKEDYV